MPRPKSDNPKTHMLALRMTEEEHATITRAAGRGLSKWARGVLLRAAKRAIVKAEAQRDHEIGDME